MSEERWKPVPYYAGLYSVSDLGRVRNEKTGREYYPRGQKHDGYTKVAFVKNKIPHTYSMAQVVAQAFVPGKTEARCWVGHLDGDHSNNAATNLRWMTPGEANTLREERKRNKN